ncbi:MAG TPA: beta-galactosidase, partial [Thermomicrobiales bacterium]
MPLVRTLLVVLILATSTTFLAPSAEAAPPAPAPRRLGPSPYSMEPLYFPETSHYISGRIRQYWEEYGGLAAFGYPLTGIFWDLQPDNDIRRVQYFERVRMEYVQGNAQPYDILLTLIGNEITADRSAEGPFQPATPLSTPGTTFAASTGHNLGGIFRQWWEGYGGLERFGYPLSEEFRERNDADGREYTVQYFERARFEYHPEAADTANEVQLGQLGRERLLRVGAPAIRVAPETTPPTGDDLPGYYLPRFPLIVGQAELGANAYLLGPHDGDAATYNLRATGKLNEAGLGWVRFQLVWRDFEPWRGHYDWLPLDTRIEAAHAAGLKILLSVVKPPDWAAPPGKPGAFPENITPFYNMLTEVTSRYRGQVQAYEIGNEPNLASEVGGEVEIPRYFENVKAGYLAIKRTEPTAIVVLGGLLATGENNPALAVSAPTFLR